jgi:DNA-binding transcriptional MerR regulator
MAARNQGEATRLSPPPRASRTRLPAAPEPYRYSIADLERETGVNSRNIRYYISEGLLPPAYGRGPTATYDLGHLLRLRMIAKLRDDGIALRDIRERLSELDDEQIAATLKIQTRPPEDRWRRVQLHPSLELHVREPGGEPDLALEEAVELLVRLAQPVIDRIDEPNS